ncbi:MAG: hypothetical protein AAF590_02465 [Pseudomonadota bacterium]
MHRTLPRPSKKDTQTILKEVVLKRAIPELVARIVEDTDDPHAPPTLMASTRPKEVDGVVMKPAYLPFRL